MLWLARIGRTAILGLPTCGAYSKATAADLLLPRLLTGEPPIRSDGRPSLGHGGVLTREMRFRFPPYARELDAPGRLTDVRPAARRRLTGCRQRLRRENPTYPPESMEPSPSPRSTPAAAWPDAAPPAQAAWPLIGRDELLDALVATSARAAVARSS